MKTHTILVFVANEKETLAIPSSLAARTSAASDCNGEGAIDQSALPVCQPKQNSKAG